MGEATQRIFETEQHKHAIQQITQKIVILFNFFSSRIFFKESITGLNDAGNKKNKNKK